MHNHWSAYWARGTLTSLPEDFPANYDGEVASFWQQIFSKLEGLTDLLDVCTGNGPIALLAAEWAAREKVLLRITAVDAAYSQPQEIRALTASQQALMAQIRFMSDTPVEELPFPAESFDLVTSQFGIEYCKLDRAGPQLARVLRPGGVFAVVSHNVDTEMVRVMSEELKAYTALDRARVIKLLSSWGRGQLGEREFVKAAQRALNGLQAEDQAIRQSLLIGQVSDSLSQLLRMPPTILREQKQAAAGYAAQLRSGRDRLDDMLRVNRLIADNPCWHRPLESAGLELMSQSDLNYRGEHRMGTCYEWRKPQR